MKSECNLDDIKVRGTGLNFNGIKKQKRNIQNKLYIKILYNFRYMNFNVVLFYIYLLHIMHSKKIKKNYTI